MLNPFRETDAAILQDTDLAGPIAFILAFGGFLLLVNCSVSSLLKAIICDLYHDECIKCDDRKFTLRLQLDLIRQHFNLLTVREGALQLHLRNRSLWMHSHLRTTQFNGRIGGLYGSYNQCAGILPITHSGPFWIQYPFITSVRIFN